MGCHTDDSSTGSAGARTAGAVMEPVAGGADIEAGGIKNTGGKASSPVGAGGVTRASAGRTAGGATAAGEPSAHAAGSRSAGTSGVPATGATVSMGGEAATGSTAPSAGIAGADGTAPSTGIAGADGTAPSSGIAGADGTAPSAGIAGADGTAPLAGIAGADGTAPSAGTAGLAGMASFGGTEDASGGAAALGGIAGSGGEAMGDEVAPGGGTSGGEAASAGMTGGGEVADAPGMGGGAGHDDVQPMGPMSTDGVLCDLEGNGMQRLVYDQNRRRGEPIPIDVMLPYRFAWNCADTVRTLSANGVPNHGVVGGRFATLISEQNIQISVSLSPVVTDAITQLREPGFALNGVKFEPGTAGTCPNDAGSDQDCSYAMGRDAWQMVATPGETSQWRFGFGVDENDAHVQPNGQYHYHGNPLNLVAQLNPDFETSMTLVGWAQDGFPIYALYGYIDAADANSGLVKMRSSYVLVDTPGAGRPAVDDFALGHFEQDWVYEAGRGTLDECNGRFGVTPEFPRGTYHYYTTETYPFVQRCVRGTARVNR
ncbi:MAG: YHYH protein [Myxococcota bacterium]|nr:YHYH protein [Myxococcota bacterium]